jgi:hypothetical protein
MNTTTTIRTNANDPDCVAETALHLHDAECALHAARQAHVDAWIAAANDKLHQALAEYLTAIAARNGTDRP